MGADHITVRNVDQEVWRDFKVAAIRLGKRNLGELLTEVLREWLERHRESDEGWKALR